MRTDRGFEILTVVACLVFIALYFAYQAHEKRECRERGGKVVPVQGSEFGWFCDE